MDLLFIFNNHSVWFVNNDSNVTRISSITWTQINVISFDKSNFNWEMSFDIVLFNQFFEFYGRFKSVFNWNRPFIHILCKMTIYVKNLNELEQIGYIDTFINESFFFWMDHVKIKTVDDWDQECEIT
jgi:hypothetical protein